MKLKGIINIKSFIIIALAFLTTLGFLNKNNVRAMDKLDLENGSYEATYTITSDGASMVKKSFDSKLLIEVIDDNYYMTITKLKDSVVDLKLKCDSMIPGVIISKGEGVSEEYTYTMSKERLMSEISFTAYVIPMKMEVELSYTINASSITRISDEVRDLGERPAQYIPSLVVTGATSYEVIPGNEFTLPAAKATLGSESLIPSYRLYLNDKEIELSDRKIILNDEGDYRLIIEATSDKYKTSLNNPTSARLIIKINVNVDNIEAVKIEDINNVIPFEASIQAGIIAEGSSMDLIDLAMKKYSVNYVAYNALLLSADGSNVRLNNDIRYSIYIPNELKDSKLQVYHIDNDKVTKLKSHIADGYITFDTNLTGIFVIGKPGVPFSLPVWQYGVIGLSAAIVLIGGSVAGIIAYRKSKKRKQENK